MGRLRRPQVFQRQVVGAVWTTPSPIHFSIGNENHATCLLDALPIPPLTPLLIGWIVLILTAVALCSEQVTLAAGLGVTPPEQFSVPKGFESGTGL